MEIFCPLFVHGNVQSAKKTFILVGGFAPSPPTMAAPLDPPCFRIEDPSQNWLASESGLVCFSVLYAWGHMNQNKNNQYSASD